MDSFPAPEHLFVIRGRWKRSYCSEDEVADGLYDAIRKACSDENADTLLKNVVFFGESYEIMAYGRNFL